MLDFFSPSYTAWKIASKTAEKRKEEKAKIRREKELGIAKDITELWDRLKSIMEDSKKIEELKISEEAIKTFEIIEKDYKRTTKEEDKAWLVKIGMLNMREEVDYIQGIDAILGALTRAGKLKLNDYGWSTKVKVPMKIWANSPEAIFALIGNIREHGSEKNKKILKKWINHNLMNKDFVINLDSIDLEGGVVCNLATILQNWINFKSLFEIGKEKFLRLGSSEDLKALIKQFIKAIGFKNIKINES